MEEVEGEQMSSGRQEKERSRGAEEGEEMKRDGREVNMEKDSMAKRREKRRGGRGATT